MWTDPLISKISKIWEKNLNISMSSWANWIWVAQNSSAGSPLNSSYTSFMNRLLLLEGLASWNPHNQQNQQNGNEKLEYLHEFLCESYSVWIEFKLLIYSIMHPIQASWSNRSFVKHWPVEILKISKISKISKIEMKYLNISMNCFVKRTLFGQNSGTQSAP